MNFALKLGSSSDFCWPSCGSNVSMPSQLYVLTAVPQGRAPSVSMSPVPAVRFQFQYDFCFPGVDPRQCNLGGRKRDVGDDRTDTVVANVNSWFAGSCPPAISWVVVARLNVNPCKPMFSLLNFLSDVLCLVDDMSIDNGPYYDPSTDFSFWDLQFKQAYAGLFVLETHVEPVTVQEQTTLDTFLLSENEFY